MDSVAIVGVGLIGGSFALALRKAGYSGQILGVSSPRTLERAVALGAIDAGTSLEHAARQADLIYLAQPVQGIISTLPLLAQWVRPSALVTDAGSTKLAIMEAGAGLGAGQFLGGHPLAGKESRGVDVADPDLFRGRSYVLTPESLRTKPQVVQFVHWLERIGAVPLWMEAEIHDKTLAYTSHLPQLASTALAALLGEQGPEVLNTYGPALLESTRLALSSYDLWRDIIETNRREIDSALSGYIGVLEKIRVLLGSSEMTDYFKQGERFGRQLRRQL